MKMCSASSLLLLFMVSFYSINAQLPPRLSIPGAILLPQGRESIPYQQERAFSADHQQQRQKRPQLIRPVIEESEDRSNFDNEVNKLGLSVLQSAVRQAEDENHVTSRPSQTTIQFRPERPIPVLRQDIRDNYPSERPSLRQDIRDNYPSERPSLRPKARQQEHNREIQGVKLVQQRPQVQQNRQPPRLAPRPIEDDDEPRKRKPVVQILRKYRTDNADGSITWGFENEDGTFKEETIGVDCIIRGKYGYVDPDGVKREYSYESGNPCDKPEEEEEDLPPQVQGRREQLQPQQAKKLQYRPIGQ